MTYDSIQKIVTVLEADYSSSNLTHFPAQAPKKQKKFHPHPKKKKNSLSFTKWYFPALVLK